jgi:hypothetical protein
MVSGVGLSMVLEVVQGGRSYFYARALDFWEAL